MSHSFNWSSFLPTDVGWGKNCQNSNLKTNCWSFIDYYVASIVWGNDFIETSKTEKRKVKTTITWKKGKITI